MRLALFALLFAAFAQAGARSGVLVSPLPDELMDRQILEITRQVLVARGWTLVTDEQRGTIGAEKDLSAMRLFIDDKGLRFNDEAQRPRGGGRQPAHQGDVRPRTAVPQEEIDGLRTDLVAAFAGKTPAAAGAPPKPAGQALLAVPAGSDPRKVMAAARNAFARHKWAVSSDAEGALVARNRNFDIDSTLKVFLADGTLRFIDGTVDTKGRRAQVPERWLNYIRSDLRRSLAVLERRAAAVRDADPAERLRKLKSMLDAGLITQAEYDQKRAEIIKGL